MYIPSLMWTPGTVHEIYTIISFFFSCPQQPFWIFVFLEKSSKCIIGLPMDSHSVPQKSFRINEKPTLYYETNVGLSPSWIAGCYLANFETGHQNSIREQAETVEPYQYLPGLSLSTVCSLVCSKSSVRETSGCGWMFHVLCRLQNARAAVNKERSGDDKHAMVSLCENLQLWWLWRSRRLKIFSSLCGKFLHCR